MPQFLSEPLSTPFFVCTGSEGSGDDAVHITKYSKTLSEQPAQNTLE